jgi:hypothetical protein
MWGGGGVVQVFAEGVFSQRQSGTSVLGSGLSNTYRTSVTGGGLSNTYKTSVLGVAQCSV